MKFKLKKGWKVISLFQKKDKVYLISIKLFERKGRMIIDSIKMSYIDLN